MLRRLCRPTKLVDVSLEMLEADLVVGFHMGTLHQRPEELDAIGVSLAADVLPNRVLDGLMVREIFVDIGVIGVNHGSPFCVPLDEFSHLWPPDTTDNLGVDKVGVSVLYSSDRNLAFRSPACQVRPLGSVHILPSSPDVELVHFNRPIEHQVFIVEALPKSVHHEPGRLVAHLHVAGQLHGRDTLQAGCPEIDGPRPTSSEGCVIAR